MEQKNYDKMSMRDLMASLLADFNGHEEEFEAIVQEALMDRVNFVVDEVCRAVDDIWKAELTKTYGQYLIGLQALQVIKSTKDMTISQREQLPYNWKIAEIAIAEMEAEK